MKLVSIKKLVNTFKTNDVTKFDYRKNNLVTNIEFLIQSFELSKFDIMYMENLKKPLTHDEQIYFVQQIDRINSSIKILDWMKDNVKSNQSFWRKLLKWKT
jgi:hypothetical protein